MSCKASIVVEWENVLLAEDERCVEMLRRLRSQIVESGVTIEVLVVFNPEQVAETIIRQAVGCHLNPDTGATGQMIDCHIIPGRGLHYYDLKNLGAQCSQGELVLFIDSDVIPEATWLHSLLAPFQQHQEIQVVAGQTHIDADSLMGKAFSLGWFFPLRRPHGIVTRRAKSFFANNVAFRRETFSHLLFPPMSPGVTRGACVELARSLEKNGIEILKTSSACCSHPPPNGWRHFFARSLAEGRDSVDRRAQSGRSKLIIAIGFARDQISRARKSAKRIIKHRSSVELSGFATPVAVLVMTVFHLNAVIGAWIYLAAPALAGRLWRI